MKKYVIPGLLILAALVLYAFRLDFPAKEYYDEVYHVKTAREFLTLSGNTDTSHPPLGKMMIALTLRVFGDHSLIWRTAPLFSGLGILFVFFLLAKKFFKNAKPALFATVLLGLDGILITQSRIAMLNTPMLFFMLLALWFFVLALEEGGKIHHFLLSGIFLGLTAATRWVGLGIVLVMGILLIRYFTLNWKKAGFILKGLLWMVGMSVIVYFLATAFLLLIKGYHLKDLWLYQIRMLRYHSTLKAKHNYAAAWWGWPVMVRPIWYFFERKSGIIRGILCIGNPAVLWAFIPALGYLIWDVFKTRSARTAFVIAGFLSQWLPWAFIGRVKFFHYYFSAMPFVALGLAIYFQALWNTGRAGKIFAACYFLVVLAMAVYWYPLWTGYPISEKFFQNHLWFKTWI